MGKNKNAKLSKERLLPLIERINEEFRHQAFDEIPEDKFTWSHKQKALDTLARINKMYDDLPATTNNVFILTRSDDPDSEKEIKTS